MFKLHPKVYAALVAVALVALGSADNALNGAETWREAGIQTGTAAFVAAIAYLKGSGPAAPAAPYGGSPVTIIGGDPHVLAGALASSAPQA